MYTVAVRRDFCARHFLVGGDWGPENQVHEHPYRIELRVTGEKLNEHQYLVDITILEGFLDQQIGRFQDKTLNDFREFHGINPSLEAFARILCRAFADRILPEATNTLGCEVRLWESEEAWASYSVER
jgi:6-pyruvoyltetrahydropterin/6-carboxytetrahydropterin synthase